MMTQAMFDASEAAGEQDEKNDSFSFDFAGGLDLDVGGAAAPARAGRPAVSATAAVSAKASRQTVEVVDECDNVSMASLSATTKK